MLKKIRLVYAFCLIRIRNQSRSVWLGTYCCSFSQPQLSAYNISTEAERCRILFPPSTFLSFGLRCFGYGWWLRCCWNGMHAGKKKYQLKVSTKYVVISISWSRCCCCCCCVLLRGAASAHKIRTDTERGITSSCLVAARLLLFTHLEGCADKNQIGFCFPLDTSTQSIAFSVTGYVLLLFLTAPGLCFQHHYWSRETCRKLFLPFTFLSSTLRCFRRLLLYLFLAVSISVL